MQTISAASPATIVASGQSCGPESVLEITVTGTSRVRPLIGSISGATERPIIETNIENVVAPSTSRCGSATWAVLRARNSGPSLPQYPPQSPCSSYPPNPSSEEKTSQV